jgi:hypothetical protein
LATPVAAIVRIARESTHFEADSRFKGCLTARLTIRLLLQTGDIVFTARQPPHRPLPLCRPACNPA